MDSFKPSIEGQASQLFQWMSSEGHDFLIELVMEMAIQLYEVSTSSSFLFQPMFWPFFSDYAYNIHVET